MANIKKTAATIMTDANDGNVTPYEVFVVLRETLEGLNIEAATERAATLVPQMMYNYDRNGLINGVKAKETKVAGRYTLDEVNAFVAKFVKKNFKVDPAKVTAKLPESGYGEFEIES